MNTLSPNHTINFDGVTCNTKNVCGFWWLGKTPSWGRANLPHDTGI